jgi:membrane-associated phospholipid phosphatase
MVWRSRREWFPAFAGAALLILYVGLVASIAVPTAPPWLAGETGHTVAVTRVMQELLARVSGSAYESGATAVGVNDVAAMPSLHTGITMLLALAAWRFDRRLGLLGFVYTASMGFTLVYFGEHYVMDVLAGAALAVVCWRLALLWWSPAAGSLNAGAERVATQASETLRAAGATAAALDDTASAA